MPLQQKREACEVMSGVLEVCGERVLVRVYRTSREHFAVLGGRVSLNLRACCVKRAGEGRLCVTPREGPAITLRGPHMDAWACALDARARKPFKTPLLPSLVESEETTD